MYRIRSTDGLEAEYGSLEEFAAAVRRGEVTPDAEIFHVRANRWLDIKSHPHYRLACSAPSSASSAPAAVAAPPATPVPVVPRAARRSRSRAPSTPPSVRNCSRRRRTRVRLRRPWHRPRRATTSCSWTSRA